MSTPARRAVADRDGYLTFGREQEQQDIVEARKRRSVALKDRFAPPVRCDVRRSAAAAPLPQERGIDLGDPIGAALRLLSAKLQALVFNELV
jgi:hypothetical protein